VGDQVDFAQARCPADGGVGRPGLWAKEGPRVDLVSFL